MQRWLAHSPMTEPAELAALFDGLPSDVGGLNRVVQGLLIHGDHVEKYGDDPGAFGPVSRATLPVKQRLEALLKRDGHALDKARLPTWRQVGTCRDFALMVCAFLRAAGTAARVRCGFAGYFAETWEDHWVCEYWNRSQERWCLTDAQIDDVQKAAFQVRFDIADVPRAAFLTAGEAWLRCRASHDNPERFGQGSVRGLWFMTVNVVRDAYAVNNRETSPWDRWRECPPQSRTVSSEEARKIDALARHPEGPVQLVPPWLDA